MLVSHPSSNQIQYVSNFDELVNTAFHGQINALCWKRELRGDYAEIVAKVNFQENMVKLNPKELLKLSLSPEGDLARNQILQDLEALKAHGASPILNIIENYERDEIFPFFPTDVYSYHVDRSPIPTATFLCTYFGEASDILPNSQARQKILVPEIRAELQKIYDGDAAGFDAFLSENFFDLHYEAKENALPINLGLGHLWKLAVDHPESPVLPCVHRAPKEKNGERRLLLIC